MDFLENRLDSQMDNLQTTVYHRQFFDDQNCKKRNNKIQIIIRRVECFQMKMHSVKATSNSYKTLAQTVK